MTQEFETQQVVGVEIQGEGVGEPDGGDNGVVAAVVENIPAVVRPLNDRQERYCREYVKLRSQYRAAIAAGYEPSNSRCVSTKLMKDPRIKARIKELEESGFSGKGVGHPGGDLVQSGHESKSVIKALFDMLTFDIRSVLDIQDGEVRYKPLNEWPEGASRLISEIETKKGRNGVDGLNIKIKIPDKSKALELLARHYGLLNDKMEVNVSSDIGEQLRLARERVQQNASRRSRRKQH